MGHIGGFCHLYIGQEAVVVGVLMTINKNDSVVTTYRDHGHMIARGLEPKKIMSELTGKSSGYSKGKGGSMHMFSKDNNFYGGHGIVGAQAPIGTGVAFTHKYINDGNICRTYIGDGAMNNGQVFEAFNLASLWKLPVLYIIENNQYAMGTALGRGSAQTELYRRGESIGIDGVQVDGMDVLAVKAAGDEAVAHVRAGKGPILMEMETYRYRGHSMSDPAKYRTKEEVQRVRSEQDPIDQLREKILGSGLVNEDVLKAFDREVKGVVTEAAEFAQNSPEPERFELYTDVLAEA